MVKNLEGEEVEVELELAPREGNLKPMFCWVCVYWIKFLVCDAVRW